ncbi:MAG: hypothetical protein AAFR14_11530, partial [Bacteroidota bacterium]
PLFSTTKSKGAYKARHPRDQHQQMDESGLYTVSRPSRLSHDCIFGRVPITLGHLSSQHKNIRDMTHFLRVFIAVCCLALLGVAPSCSQSTTDTITVREGEVFDILVLNLKPNKQDELKAYFRGPSVIARRMSYQPLPGFTITAQSRGNLHPDNLILAKWESLDKREAFLRQIEVEVPDFHERRRDIWSYFGMRYYEMPEDVSMHIDRTKYHVATAYWLESTDAVSEYYTSWRQQIQNQGGESLITLSGGTSPFGYRYDPAFFVMTAWQDEATFDKFQATMEGLKMDKIAHVNEFILE